MEQNIELTNGSNEERKTTEAKKIKLDKDCIKDTSSTIKTNIAETIGNNRQDIDEQKLETVINDDNKIKAIPKDQDFNFTIKEEEVGMTEYYIKENSGFHGIIKQLFSDFIVNEIDVDGNVLKLEKDMQDPNNIPLPKRKSGEKKEIKIQDDEKEKEIEVDFDAIEELLKDGFEKIKQMVQDQGTSISSHIIPLKIENKENRTQLHMTIREYLGSKIMTQTKNDGLIQFVFMKNKKQKKMNQARVSKNEAINKERYLHFNLYKENRDTHDIINQMIRMLRSNNKNFSIAGTKDKRGITVQRISMFNGEEDRLKGLFKGIPGAQISSFSKQKEPLRLGDLNGNQFQLVIRNLQFNDKSIIETQEKMNQILTQFKEGPGFINYFGMQRFGTNSIGTHEIGSALLNNDWKYAVDLILMPREGDSGRSKEAREHWEKTQNPKETLEMLPNYLVAEKSILNGFIENKDLNNYLNAIKRIPRNLKTLYVHAYQSYVWNLAVSKRLQCHGFKLIIGDLVELDDGTVSCVESEEDLKKYTIQQLVLPLPGHSISYPKYTDELYELYENIMVKNNLNPNQMVRSEKDLSLTGDYRKVIIQPKDFSWEFINYKEANEQLLLSDSDINNNMEKPKSKEDGNLLALILSFKLPPSGYATMLLRELLHIKTDKASIAAIST
ncbi:tRNA pseudouridine synthase D [Neoconidiobolus thromboides FSU 785]|nr:tRNA pseudouridine synthase D [Neoconidiobolus thromboides FSU 785]